MDPLGSQAKEVDYAIDFCLKLGIHGKHLDEKSPQNICRQQLNECSLKIVVYF